MTCKGGVVKTDTSLRLLVVVVVSILLFAGAASGTTYVVKPDQSGDFPTIQAAILAATDEDIIELTDGTFEGEGNRDIQVPARPITSARRAGTTCAASSTAEGVRERSTAGSASDPRSAPAT